MANEYRSRPETPVSSAGAPPESVAGAARRVQRRARPRAAEALHEAEAAATAALPPAPVPVAVPVTPVPAPRGIAESARAAGDGLGRAVRFVRETEAEDVIGAAKGFIRRHPASVFGVAAVGFLVGRALRGR